MFRPLPRSACLSAVVLLTAVLCTRFSDGEPPLPTDIDGAVERDDGLRALSEAHRDQAGGATKVEQGGVGASLKDIKAVGIEVNYRSANLLSHADLTGAQLRKAKLSGGVKAFYETKFDSADLTEARLTGKAAFQAASFT